MFLVILSAVVLVISLPVFTLVQLHTLDPTTVTIGPNTDSDNVMNVPKAVDIFPTISRYVIEAELRTGLVGSKRRQAYKALLFHITKDRSYAEDYWIDTLPGIELP